MKLNGKILVTVAMMVGSMTLATGCNKSSENTTQPESSPAPTGQQPAAPAEETKTAIAPAAQEESATVSASFRVGAQTPIYAPSAPPAPRYEVVGRPPSAGHFWVKGHWSYNGRDWVWVGGHWDVQRAGYTYVAPHWDIEHGRHRFMRGHWVRRA
jgi:hypothetical protein